MDRRQFLQSGLGAAAWGFGACASFNGAARLLSATAPSPPAFSVIPVVGDGRWIWTKAPDNETGYLEPRPYSLKVGIVLEGRGDAERILATTTVPLEYPEQKIEQVTVETQGCEAELRKVSSGGGQLILAAAQIAKGQTISAVANYRLSLSKQYFSYTRDQFPVEQKPPAEIRNQFLQDSPGIQTRAPAVKSLAGELSRGHEHPWDKAEAFAKWVPKNIAPQIGSYTSVTAALDGRRGDCEEMAGIFVALCRAVNIPARLVWIPNHTWAEFYLSDRQGQGHWIPAHTACYPWFGWNGVHELVLQKGDRIQVPERHEKLRLLEDWMQWLGRQPAARYTAELTPLPSSPGEDPGPGARRKDEKGEWVVTQDNPLDRYMRR